MDADTIRFDVDAEGVATLLLNRPEKLNAFDRDMLQQWNEALVRSLDDPAVKVIVLTGAGRAFCAGGDSGNMQKRAESPETALDRKDYLFRYVHAIALSMERLDKPVIAAINGPARGAGLDMALMCDIRIAAETATVAESYINLGLAAGDGGAFYLARLIGPDRALELLWTGRAVGAQEALELGLVTRVVRDDQLMPSAYELARRIAAQSQPAIRMSKRIFYQSMSLPLVTHLDMVSSHMAVLRDTPEYRAKLAEVARSRKK